ncbi:fumarylacetoacetate hydrolase family protein [Rubrimonas cliftonensis]|uniref:2-keto-4-pentenoate hydratase/2-oxohepta-3-ene-1,7-dioic acid hydratase (Catechol pathway) n=1 Tax=Rubrimonas cliftonensis TaxID=89524 RepID=A0A1H4DLT1_9RHOB|nr:fumarylacetoacetate hydrolase family protein [Rubrimonas cliftonensis]SEA73506.1 2-keto-4-pentenoate hydratase/2-oxohepta-3-ene-1,7-dioic acid hydratase (catechol pathway) [Rubrimonas cliftonensis]
MKLVTFEQGGKVAAGYIDGDDIVICAEGPGAKDAVRRLVEGGSDALAAWREVGAGGGARTALETARLLAPIPEPRRDLFCVGKNYYAHANEFHSSGFDSSGKEAVPTAPIIFTKATTSIVGPGDAVRGELDPTGSVDYEGELGVVIGRRAFRVSKADAYDHVFGYVVVNDVTSRELQRRHNQWVIGKGVDTFCPMGPWIATADEIGDVGAMELETLINGETRQKARVADLIFDIPTLIETMSATMTLLPGDIIATGTPEGVGIGFKPPKYLAKGDRMTVTITGLGELSNTIV